MKPTWAEVGGQEPLDLALHVPAQGALEAADRREVVFGDLVVVAGHGPLEELGADHLQEQGDAVGAAVAGDLVGDRLGNALGVVEPAVLLERDLPRRAAGARATWDGGSP